MRYYSMKNNLSLFETIYGKKLKGYAVHVQIDLNCRHHPGRRQFQPHGHWTPQITVTTWRSTGPGPRSRSDISITRTSHYPRRGSSGRTGTRLYSPVYHASIHHPCRKSRLSARYEHLFTDRFTDTR